MPSVSYVKLWTWQGCKHRIDHDAVCLRKSHLYQNADLKRKYAAVEARLGTLQIVWCFTIETPWRANETSVNQRCRWELDVPVPQIAGFVDEWLAQRLNAHLRCPELGVWSAWRKTAARTHPLRPDRQDQFIEQQLTDYTGLDMDPNGAWDNVFVGPEQSEHVSALLYRPVPRDWIID